MNSELGMHQNYILTPETGFDTMHYLKKLTKYAAIMDVYEREIEYYLSSTFPSNEKWKPPARELSPD